MPNHRYSSLSLIDQRGFSLVELAISMIVISLVIGSMLVPIAAQRKNAKISETREIIEAIDKVLLQYVAAVGRLPCPADDDTDGEEDGGGDSNCNLQHGFVPGRTLGLMGSYDDNNLFLDAWGRPIRYSVTISDADNDNLEDFTRTGELADFATYLDLAPDLVICREGDPDTEDGCGDWIINNAPYVFSSLGSDWVNFDSDCQEENAETGGTDAVSDDLTFCQSDYSIAEGDEYDDILRWGVTASIYNAALGNN